MNRHKKRISLLTLAVFVLLTVLSGTAMAAKTPVAKDPVAKPSMNSQGGSGAGATDGEKVDNHLFPGTPYPHLEAMSISPGSIDQAFVTDENDSSTDGGTYTATVMAESINLSITPSNDYCDWNTVRYWDGTDYVEDTKSGSAGNDARTISNIPLVDTVNTITITVGYSHWGWGGYHNHTKIYTLNVTKQIPVEGVSLELNGEPVTGDIFMSRNPKTLTAVPNPLNANYPNDPIVYTWTVEGDAVSIPSGNTGSTCVVTPEQPGTATVTVAVNGTEATASCTIHVGDIDVFVVGEPDFDLETRVYTAQFAYSSTFPVDVTLSGAQSYFSGSGTVVGTVPTLFEANVSDKDAFEVNYTYGNQRWIVDFEGIYDEAIARTYDSISADADVVDLGIGDSVTVTATPFIQEYDEKCFGGTTTIVWSLPFFNNGVATIDPNGLSCEITGAKPGYTWVKVSLKKGFIVVDSYYIHVYVYDNYRLQLDQHQLTIKRGKEANLKAILTTVPLANVYQRDDYLTECYNLKNWDQVSWGFVLNDGERDYVVESSELLSLTASGDQMENALLQANKTGKVKVIAYLANNYFTDEGFYEEFEGIPQGRHKGKSRTVYVDELREGRFDTCVVTVRSRTRVEQEPAPAPAALPEIPLPPALETLDVTITIGSSTAIVNGEQVTLAGNPLLLGADRAMVDYADMAKLIPGLEVTWDWKTLSVTFSKDGQELTMVLDEIPAGFDVPFINIGGRLVVPVRYVGSFFGATVDWIGGTLVVHMYK